jgi:hypothetical protein
MPLAHEWTQMTTNRKQNWAPVGASLADARNAQIGEPASSAPTVEKEYRRLLQRIAAQTGRRGGLPLRVARSDISQHWGRTH